MYSSIWITAVFSLSSTFSAGVEERRRRRESYTTTTSSKLASNAIFQPLAPTEYSFLPG